MVEPLPTPLQAGEERVGRDRRAIVCPGERRWVCRTYTKQWSVRTQPDVDAVTIEHGRAAEVQFIGVGGWRVDARGGCTKRVERTCVNITDRCHALQAHVQVVDVLTRVVHEIPVGA